MRLSGNWPVAFQKPILVSSKFPQCLTSNLRRYSDDFDGARTEYMKQLRQLYGYT